MSPGLRSLLTGICLLMMVPIANATVREGLVLQVSENDPQVWDTVLNIAHNAPK